MIALVILQLLVCVAAPLAYAWRLWRLREPTRLASLIAVAEASLFTALVMVLGRWDIAGYYVRAIVLAAFVLAVLAALYAQRDRPWRDDASPVLRRKWPGLVSVAVLGVALVWVLGGMRQPQEILDLEFPLRDGRFIVGLGGRIALLNRHAAHPQQRHAADITALGRAGFRANGLLPAEPGRYAIHRTPVVSPCRGRVRSVEDGLPDLPPPHTDPDHPAGNHVVIDCGRADVELAHLRKGSIVVRAEQSVDAGDPIGEVGNSGNTTEPHLHVHAVDRQTGLGVAIAFDGRMPVRNRLYPN